MKREIFNNLERIDISNYQFPEVLELSSAIYNEPNSSPSNRHIEDKFLLTYKRGNTGKCAVDPEKFNKYFHDEPYYLESRDLDNIPTSGIKLLQLNYSVPESISCRGKYWCGSSIEDNYSRYMCGIIATVEDPRGFTVNICNPRDLILNNKVVKGEIQGEFVYVWVDSCIILVSYDSDLYRDLIERRANPIITRSSDLRVGQGYKFYKSSDIFWYLGRGRWNTSNLINHINSDRLFTKEVSDDVVHIIKEPYNRYLFTNGEILLGCKRPIKHIDFEWRGNTIDNTEVEEYLSIFNWSVGGDNPSGIEIDWEKYERECKSLSRINYTVKSIQDTLKSGIDKSKFYLCEGDDKSYLDVVELTNVSNQPIARVVGKLVLSSSKIKIIFLDEMEVIDDTSNLKGVLCNSFYTFYLDNKSVIDFIQLRYSAGVVGSLFNNKGKDLIGYEFRS